MTAGAMLTEPALAGAGANTGAQPTHSRAYVAPDAMLRPVAPLTEPPALQPADDAQDADGPSEPPADGYVCPAATTDIAYNLARRQEAIDVAFYGPLDPSQDNVAYWERAASAWRVDIEAIKAARCINCAAFNLTTVMLSCIVDGIGGAGARDVTNAGGMGYCELFGFTCLGTRRCDAWIAGGPITDGLEASMLEDDSAEEDIEQEEYKASAISAPAWIQANAKRGLAWHLEGKSGDGVTDKTLREARAMAAGSVSSNKAMRMAAWFARHMSDLDAPDAQEGSKGYPSAGVVAHALWGGGTRRQSQRAAAWARTAYSRTEDDATQKKRTARVVTSAKATRALAQSEE